MFTNVLFEEERRLTDARQTVTMAAAANTAMLPFLDNGATLPP